MAYYVKYTTYQKNLFTFDLEDLDRLAFCDGAFMIRTWPMRHIPVSVKGWVLRYLSRQRFVDQLLHKFSFL